MNKTIDSVRSFSKFYLKMVLAEFYKMVAKTRGAEFIFEDSLYGI